MTAAIPKSLAAATRMLERYADLDARIAALEEDRTKAIAAANQRADVAAAPMIKERDVICAAIESWWPHAAPLIAGGNKSVQLGGCVIGTRKSKDKLAHSFETDDVAALALFKTRFRKHATRLKVALDRMATLKLLQVGGKTGAAIAELGFTVEQGSDQFFVERAQQAATIGQ